MDRRSRLRAADLNLLPVLRELLRTRNVTRAAAALHMSQSAVSEALGRLRLQFGDPLLVRSGRGMAPTRLAEALTPKVEQALAAVETAVEKPHFEPSRIAREFLVATADTIILAVGTRLVSRLAREAPRLSVQFINPQHVDPAALHSGALDLIVLPRGALKDRRLKSLALYREEFVAIARRGHPGIRGNLSRQQIAALTTVAYRSDQASPLIGTLRRGKLDQMRVPQFTLLPFLVERTDAVALLQRHIALLYARILDIQIVELPNRPPPLEVRAYWSTIHHEDAAHRWFRGLLQEAARVSDLF
jgi:DNA-binding transcriptional LysR family regulator